MKEPITTTQEKRENVVRLYPRRYPVEEVAYRAVCGRDVIPRFRKIQMRMISVLSGAPAFAAATGHYLELNVRILYLS